MSLTLGKIAFMLKLEADMNADMPPLPAHPTAMEPLLPSSARLPELRERSYALAVAAAELTGSLAPLTRLAVASVVRVMNSYYSNLIEGHRTFPRDFEAAHDSTLSAGDRELADLGIAHLRVQMAVASSPAPTVMTPEFVRRLHRTFYEHLPTSLRTTATRSGVVVSVVPGAWRTGEVSVGHHNPPHWGSVPAFLDRFCDGYRLERLDPLDRIIATAAAHHRLAWIHPFPDGNGRVARLFTDAMFDTCVPSHGLWRVSRACARRQDAYRDHLANADRLREGDLDGRGNLSDRRLGDWCSYLIDEALDQVHFMVDCLKPDGVRQRILSFGDREVAQKRMHPRAPRLLAELFARGSIPRQELPELLGVTDRHARRIVDELAHASLLSAEPGKPIEVNLTSQMAPWYFPFLYPPDVEARLVDEGRVSPPKPAAS